MLQAPYAYFLERARATELHDAPIARALPTNPGPKRSDDRKGGAGRWLDGEFAGVFPVNSR